MRRWFRLFPTIISPYSLTLLSYGIWEGIAWNPRYFFFLQNTTFWDGYFLPNRESSNRGICLPPGPHTLVCVAFYLQFPFHGRYVSSHYPFSPYIFLGSKIIYQLNHGETTLDFGTSILKAVVLLQSRFFITECWQLICTMFFQNFGNVIKPLCFWLPLWCFRICIWVDKALMLSK